MCAHGKLVNVQVTYQRCLFACGEAHARVSTTLNEARCKDAECNSEAVWR